VPTPRGGRAAESRPHSRCRKTSSESVRARIKTHGLDAIDVCFCDVAFAPLFPKGIGPLWADQLIAQLFDLAERLHRLLEMEHVTLRLEPVAQVRATQHKRLPLAVDEISSGGVDEARLG